MMRMRWIWCQMEALAVHPRKGIDGMVAHLILLSLALAVAPVGKVLVDGLAAGQRVYLQG